MKKFVAILLTLMFIASFSLMVACGDDKDWVVVETVKATCTSEGYTLKKKGTEVKKFDIVAPLGHDYKDVGIITPASCHVEGSKAVKCSRCNDEKTESIPKTEHDYVYSSTITPTCSNIGYDIYICKNCDDVKQQNYTNPTGHNYQVKDTVEPTCLEQGYTVKECNHEGCDCKTINTDYVNPLGHNWVIDSTFIGNYGVNKYKCDRTNCGETKVSADTYINDQNYIGMKDGETFLGSDFQNYQLGATSIKGYSTSSNGALEIVADNSTSNQILEVKQPTSGTKSYVYSNAFEVEGGKAFKLYYKYKAGNYNATANITLLFFKVEETGLKSMPDYAVKITGNVGCTTETVQEYVSDGAIVPSEAVYCVIRFENNSSSGGSSYYDDLRIVYLESKKENLNSTFGFTNSDFESQTSGKVDFWQNLYIESEYVTLEDHVFTYEGIYCNTVKSGDYALAIKNIDGSEKGVVSLPISITPTIKYEISLFACNHKIYSYSDVKITFYKDCYKLKQVGTVLTQSMTNDSWKKLDFEFTAPTDANYMVISLISRGASSVAFFDKITVIERKEAKLIENINEFSRLKDDSGVEKALSYSEVGLSNINPNYAILYTNAFYGEITKLDRDLTKAEIQTLINDVNDNPENYIEIYTVGSDFKFTNSDFELKNQDGTVAFWQPLNISSDRLLLEKTMFDSAGTVAGKAMDGDTCLYVKTDRASTEQGVITPILKVSSSTKYQINLYAANCAMYQTARITVNLYSDASLKTNVATYTDYVTNCTFKQITLNFTTPNTAKYMTISLTANGFDANNPTHLWGGFFDALRVIEYSENKLIENINYLASTRNTTSLATVLSATEVNLENCNTSKYASRYMVGLYNEIDSKGRFLTKAEIQAIINSVNANPNNYQTTPVLLNGSFEDYDEDTNTFANWSLYSWHSTGGFATYYPSTTYHSDGDISLNIVKNSGTVSLSSNLIEVDVGDYYYISFDILSLGFEPASYLNVKLLSDENTVVQQLMARRQAKDKWSELGMIVLIPEDVVYLQFSVSEESTVTICNVYFDNVKIIKTDKDGITDEFNKLLDNLDNKYQIRNMLATTCWISTGFRHDRLERYIYEFNKIRKANGKITYQEIIDVVHNVDANVDATDNNILTDIKNSFTNNAITVNELGYVDLPSDLQSVADNYYVQMSFVENGIDTNYAEVKDGKLLIKQQPIDNDLLIVPQIKISLGNTVKYIDYNVTIKGVDKPINTLNMINFDLIKGANKSADLVLTDLNLPTSLNGQNVTWSSSSGFILTDGTVILTEPGYSQIVTLTANVLGYTKNINVVVGSAFDKTLTYLDVENASFEDGVDNWYKYSDFGEIEHSKEHVFDGEYSLKTVPRIVDTVPQECRYFVNGIFDVTEGLRYYASAMVYSTSTEDWPGVWIAFYNIQGKLIDCDAKCYNTTKPNTWQKLTSCFTAPVGAVSIKVYLFSTNDVAWFDCINVAKFDEVDNADFSMGAVGWTLYSGAQVQGEKLVLTNGQSAISNPVYKSSLQLGYPLIREMDYTVSADLIGKGKIKVNFFTTDLNDGSPIPMGSVEKAFDFATVQRAELSFFTPKGTYNLNATIVLSAEDGSATFDNVEIEHYAYGTQFVEGSFEGNAQNYWTFTNAQIVSENATDGTKAVKIEANGVLSTKHMALYVGKTYQITFDVLGGNTSGISVRAVYYDKWNSTYYFEEQKLGNIRNYDLTYTGNTAKFTLVPIVYSAYCIIEIKAGDSACYVDNFNLYALSTSVSNYNFESSNDENSGTFPFQWKMAGKLATNVITGYNMPDGICAVDLKGNGTFESAYISCDKFVTYEASIYSKLATGDAKLYIAYYTENFAYLGKSAGVNLNSTNDFRKVSCIAETPDNCAYYTLLFEVNGHVVIDKAFSETNVRDVSNTTQTFYDDWIIESSSGVERVSHEAEISDFFNYNNENDNQKTGSVFSVGTVIYDEQDNIYKMWYSPRTNVDGIPYGFAYAESIDGVNWTYPNLGLCLFHGNTDNNYLEGRYKYSSLSVYKDIDEPNPDHRYKMIFCLLGEGNDKEGYYVGYSPDGKNIVEYEEFLHCHDVVSSAYDEENDLYVILPKCFLERRDQHVIVVKTLEDLLTVEEVIPIKHNSVATPLDGLNCYLPDSNDVSVYCANGTYVGLSNQIQLEDPSDLMIGITNVKLLFSRDLTEDWQRPTYDSVIPNTEEGTYLYGFKSLSSNWFSDDEHVWLYCGSGLSGQWCNRTLGDIDKTSAAQFIATWRKDGFSSLHAETNGVITTNIFEIDGNSLVLNADIQEGGSIYVEILNENGEVITGYSKDDCNVITGDGVKLNVSFSSGKTISELTGNVKLKIYMENADIYSFTVNK